MVPDLCPLRGSLSSPKPDPTEDLGSLTLPLTAVPKSRQCLPLSRPEHFHLAQPLHPFRTFGGGHYITYLTFKTEDTKMKAYKRSTRGVTPLEWVPRSLQTFPLRLRHPCLQE